MKKSSETIDYSELLESQFRNQVQELAELGRKDLFYFCRTILNYDKLVERIHRPWSEKLQRLGQRGQKRKLLLLAAKDHYKSTIATIGYSLWRLVQPEGRELREVIGNANLDKSKSFLREIKWHIENNQLFKDCYGIFSELSDKWTEKTLVVQRDRAIKEPTIEATGMGVGMASQHPNLLILDDWINEKNTTTKDQLEKGIETYKQIIATIDEQGIIIIVGHCWHFSDLYNYLLNQAEDKASYDVIFAPATDKTGKIFFPEKFGEKGEILRDREEAIGPIYYNAYYLLDPSGFKGQIFQFDWLEIFDEVPKEINEKGELVDRQLSIYQAVDLATGSSEGDYFVDLTIGIDKERNIWLLDIYRQRIKFPEQLATIINQANIWKPVGISIEGNAYQTVLVQVLERMPDAKHLPFREIKNTGNKQARITGLSSLFQRKVIKVNSKLKDFIQEYLHFPKGTNDDQLDALEMAIRSINQNAVRVRWI